MTRRCRDFQAGSWRNVKLVPKLVPAALCHARIVTDPKKLAYLKAEVQKRKRPILHSPATH